MKYKIVNKTFIVLEKCITFAEILSLTKKV